MTDKDRTNERRYDPKTEAISPFEVAVALSNSRPLAHHIMALAQWQKDVLAITQTLPDSAREPFLLSCNWYPRHLSPLVTIDCPNCLGSGRARGRHKCRECKGTGRATVVRNNA